MYFCILLIMKLVVDIGNSLIKSAVFDGNMIVRKISLSEIELDLFNKLFSEYSIESGILSSVRDDITDFGDFLSSKTKFYILGTETKLPFKNRYSTPKTLGHDRIAGIAAASIMFHGKNVLVIDAGTSLTFDFLNSKNEYLGGAISPGLSMRFKALNKLTGKLPLIKFNSTKLPELIGNSTKNSILSGVVHGFVKEIEGIIKEYKSLYNQLEIIVTGGDHKYFDKLLKYKTFAAPNLVLEGLKGILDFNEEI